MKISTTIAILLFATTAAAQDFQAVVNKVTEKKGRSGLGSFTEYVINVTYKTDDKSDEFMAFQGYINGNKARHDQMTTSSLVKGGEISVGRRAWGNVSFRTRVKPTDIELKFMKADGTECNVELSYLKETAAQLGIENPTIYKEKKKVVRKVEKPKRIERAVDGATDLDIVVQVKEIRRTKGAIGGRFHTEIVVDIWTQNLVGEVYAEFNLPKYKLVGVESDEYRNIVKIEPKKATRLTLTTKTLQFKTPQYGGVEAKQGTIKARFRDETETYKSKVVFVGDTKDQLQGRK